MRRLTLDDDEHAAVLECIRRQARALADPSLHQLATTVADAPRIVAFVVSVDLPSSSPRTHATDRGIAANASKAPSSSSPIADPPDPEDERDAVAG